MKILRMLKTIVTARGLEILLLDKEVATFNNISLGIVTAIKKELSQDKIWMVVDNLEQKNIIPIEQIACVAKKVILLGDLPVFNLTSNRDLRISSG